MLKLRNRRYGDGDGLELVVIGERDEGRYEVEEFARSVYARQYGADLKTFCRELFTLRSEKGGVISCIGINMPDTGVLLSELYLDSPVEDEVSRRVGEAIERESIVELGTMAVGTSGLCRFMMAELEGLLKSRKKRFVVSTVIKTLRNTLTRLEIPFDSLVVASRDRLQPGSGDWGRYYEALPEVVCVDMDGSLGKLKMARRRSNADFFIPPSPPSPPCEREHEGLVLVMADQR